VVVKYRVNISSSEGDEGDVGITVVVLVWVICVVRIDWVEKAVKLTGLPDDAGTALPEVKPGR
jgi:hypothetical protein